jgi:hypothetical protein
VLSFVGKIFPDDQPLFWNLSVGIIEKLNVFIALGARGMSLSRLDQLRQDIITAADRDPLQAEIALMALESLHQMIVQRKSPGLPAPPDETEQIRPRPPEPGMLFGPNDGYHLFGYDETIRPALITTRHAQDMIQASNHIPFLYHQSERN